jgi:peroxiredoxin
MKHLLLSCLALLCTVVLFSQKVVECPDFTSSTVENLTVTKILQTDTSTVISFNYSTGRYSSKISVPKGSYICDVEDKDNKLYPTGINGIEFGKWVTIDASKDIDYSIIYPKLNKNVKAIDFGEGNEGGSWFIDNLQLNKVESAAGRIVNKPLKKGDNQITQLQYQSFITDTVFTKNSEEETVMINENYGETLWQVSQNNKKEYEIELIDYSKYSRSKYGDRKWRTGQSDYAKLQGEKYALLNQKLIAKVFKDSVQMDLSSLNEAVKKDANSKAILKEAKTVLEQYLLKGEAVSKDDYKLVGTDEAGSITYQPINTDDKTFAPESYLRFMKNGCISAYASSVQNSSKNRYDRDKKDSVMTNMVVSYWSKSNIKPIFIYEQEFKLQYRDENKNVTDTIFQKTNVVLKGQIKNFYSNKKVLLKYNEALPGSYKRKAFVITPDEKGNFEIRLFLDAPMAFELQCKDVTPLILEPGDDLWLTLDVDEFDETVKWSGIGSEKNNVLAAQFLFEEKKEIGMSNYYDKLQKQSTLLNPEEFKFFCDSLYELRLSFVQKYKETLYPKDYLRHYYDEYFVNYSSKSRFPRTQDYYRKQEGLEPWEIEDSYDDFKDSFHADNDLMQFAEDYESEIRSVVFFDIFSKFSDDYSMPFKGMEENYKSRNTFTDMLYSGYTAYALKYNTVCDVLSYSSWDLAQEMRDDFYADYPNTKYFNNLKSAFAKASTVAPGQMAYDFELEDLDGNKVKLSDYRGKVVYIDFWSPSCGPCRSQIENYSGKLKEKMKDKDIVFMYIACENNVQGVKKYMEKNNVTGVKLIAKKQESLIRDKYWFSGIPEYYIIGRNGQIIQRDADRPSSLLSNPQPLLDALEQ